MTKQKIASMGAPNINPAGSSSYKRSQNKIKMSTVITQRLDKKKIMMGVINRDDNTSSGWLINTNTTLNIGLTHVSAT